MKNSIRHYKHKLFAIIPLIATILLLCGCFTAGLHLQQSPIGSSSPQILSHNPFDFEIEIDGSVFSLPCAVARWKQEGFAMRAIERQVLESGEYADVMFENDSKAVLLRVVNPTENVQDLSDCTVAGAFLQDGENASTVTLSGGITLGMQRKDILALCGVPTGTDIEINSPTIKYSLARHVYISLTFNATNTLASAEVFCLEKPSHMYDAATLPNEVNSYVPPPELSHNWRDGTAMYAGALYRMPAPVASFLQNGWIIRDEATIETGGWLSGVSLQKGGQVLRTVLYNFSSSPQPLYACFVGMIESSTSATNIAILLPGGISLASTYDEIITTYGEPDDEFIYDGTIHLTYNGSENLKLVFYFDDEDKKLFDIELWATAST